ncbi:MAG: hypothetical protein GY771_07410 [bacterium]|nr:hypothetical protein [bacterium]
MEPKVFPVPDGEKQKITPQKEADRRLERVEVDPTTYNRRLETLFKALGQNVRLAPEKSQRIKEEIFDRIKEM